jgi:hypothetical protein
MAHTKVSRRIIGRLRLEAPAAPLHPRAWLQVPVRDESDFFDLHLSTNTPQRGPGAHTWQGTAK